MSVRGQRFELDLDGDDDTAADSRDGGPGSSSKAFDFFGAIQERRTSETTAPKPPTARNAASGFPSHRKRMTQSRFKESRQRDAASSRTGDIAEKDIQEPLPAQRALSVEHKEQDSTVSERRQIDQENRQKLASMSAEEIEEERQELMESLSPSFLERLLRRANIDQEDDNRDFPGTEQDKPDSRWKVAKPRKTVTFAEEDISVTPTEGMPKQSKTDSADTPDDTHQNPVSADDANLPPAGSTIHWPRAPQPPDLDPSAPSFLTDLHEKYFPSLPADPEKLEWMSSSTSKGGSTYSPDQTALDPKDIRFSFTGTLITPSMAAQIPVTAGLHHHGDAPDAAGYTIPELAMLARSTVAAQRCVAFQTLGRILYRLGRGEFGDPGDGGQGTVGVEDTLGELARGLWGEVEREGVIEICVAESEGRGVTGGRHVSANAYATEAVWLWQKGGGRRWKAA